MIRVVLPYHLRTLARVAGEVEVDLGAEPTIGALVDAVEARFPMLRGTIRDYETLRRRPFVRFYACMEDWSHAPPETALPAAVAAGREPFMIVGAMAGG